MNGLVYFSQRAEEEREAARAAADPHARDIHLAFVAAYETKVRELTPRPGRSAVHLVQSAAF